ncbi:TPA: hypothetical protein SL665_001626 [Pseudomonas aeruginosa]|uniref:hypothetical protein n=1 Tax=Pseudomonas aeruginosa TaxID=287 RepID=UPI000A8E2CD5|nr:hypothetical protein [Pseudomonas aeruginosa]MDX4034540.1 hypothetical protein [Pseudomonas aeruginosa]HBO3356364.1 hypothetical protein [Pseudomonas aeruginosa]HEJ3875313.1 hypothetical protein [Pseudomonas aeruginosa]HEJ5077382.1 hypothetical protein [Pseudomonas aeruginosa]HEJ9715271.1 hypothetical protein [Pseudomonas aeruginosa]
MRKHTPGPWEFSAGADYGDEGNYADVTALNGDVIIARVNNLIPASAANGELLAAAPNLLDALVALVECEQTTPELWEAARAAIAKATA